jgi:hypothetical protein
MDMILLNYYYYYYITQELIYCIKMYVYSREMSVYTVHIYSTGPYVHYNV